MKFLVLNAIKDGTMTCVPYVCKTKNCPNYGCTCNAPCTSFLSGKKARLS